MSANREQEKLSLEAQQEFLMFVMNGVDGLDFEELRENHNERAQPMIESLENFKETVEQARDQTETGGEEERSDGEA